MDFEKDYLEEEPLDIEEESEKPELTKGTTRDTDPQYFTNIDGIYAKDVAGRAAVEELRTLVTEYIGDYSTTERKIGKWIDGSDLYQRTFEVTGIHNDGTYDDNILGTSDIVIRDWTGYIQYDIGIGKQHFPIYGYWVNTTDWIGSWTTAGCNDLSIHAKLETSTYTLDKAIITIKYTKPSAQANLMQTAPTEEILSETPTVEEDDMR